MDKLIIPIDGRETELELEKINLDKLKLDELNPRIGFFRDNQITDKLSEEQIIFALTNKKPEAFRKLKDSIHNNRGIVNPIWVEKLKGGEYKIIEGNTRAVIYKQLQAEEPYEKNWVKILSYVLPYEVSDEQKNAAKPDEQTQKVLNYLNEENEYLDVMLAHTSNCSRFSRHSVSVITKKPRVIWS